VHLTLIAGTLPFAFFDHFLVARRRSSTSSSGTFPAYSQAQAKYPQLPFLISLC
jgi:hypothetical protein